MDSCDQFTASTAFVPGVLDEWPNKKRGEKKIPSNILCSSCIFLVTYITFSTTLCFYYINIGIQPSS